jgi:hypothetical protein
VTWFSSIKGASPDYKAIDKGDLSTILLLNVAKLPTPVPCRFKENSGFLELISL